MRQLGKAELSSRRQHWCEKSGCTSMPPNLRFECNDQCSTPIMRELKLRQILAELARKGTRHVGYIPCPKLNAEIATVANELKQTSLRNLIRVSSRPLCSTQGTLAR